MLYRTAHLALILSIPIALQQPSTLSAAQNDKEVARAIAEPPPWAALVGSTERNKYHRIQCNIAQKIRPENAIWFTDAIDATENGYLPAGCKDRKCQPPVPASNVSLGELGGSVLPPPDSNPPEIPASVAIPASGTKAKSRPARPKAPTSIPAKTRVPPPRMPPAREVTVNQLWQGITPDQELDARRRWDVWAEWALDRWCERWHVSAIGKINSDSAYSPNTEQLLLAKLKQMKEQIEDNKKRMKELKAVLEGKKKVSEK